MKNTFKYIGMTFVIFTSIILMNSCAPTAAISAKGGAILWGENCLRCHNTPAPPDFSDAQWETIGFHMKLRANLTDMEIEKIVSFLKTAN